MPRHEVNLYPNATQEVMQVVHQSINEKNKMEEDKVALQFEIAIKRIRITLRTTGILQKRDDERCYPSFSKGNFDQ